MSPHVNQLYLVLLLCIITVYDGGRLLKRETKLRW